MFWAHSYNSPAEIKALIDERSTQGLTRSSIIQHWLRSSALPFAPIPLPYSLCEAVIVAIDCEWWEHDKTKITELGVSIIDSSFVHNHNTSYLWPVLDTMITQHVRIKEKAHFVNNDFCEGHPNKFEFGKTSFVTMQEGQAMLDYSFKRCDKNNKLRPDIFVGHAVDNDIEVIKERFGFDIEALGVVVAESTPKFSRARLASRLLRESRSSRTCCERTVSPSGISTMLGTTPRTPWSQLSSCPRSTHEPRPVDIQQPQA
jgi:hypothetical protein